MFSNDCSNIHSNAKEGHVYKINIYDGLPDQLQIGYSPRPIRKFDLCEKLFKARDFIGSATKLVNIFRSAEKRVNESLESFFENLDNLNESNSPIRAEFRLPLDRIMGMSRLLDSYFSDSFVLKHSIVLNVESVQLILKFWIEFLKKPLVNAMAKMLTSILRKGSSEFPFETYFPTISAFESFMIETLFSGSTKAETAKIIWRIGKKNQLDQKSLQMMKKIKELNRLDFRGEAWSTDKMEISGETDIVKKFLVNRSFTNEVYFSTTCDLLIKLNAVTEMDEKAKLLWDSYFQYLKLKSPKSFQDNASKNLENICKLQSLRQEARYSMHRFTLADATRNIFDYETIASRIHKKSSPYHTAYMVAYKYIADQNETSKNEIDLALIRVAMVIGLEYIHAKGPFSFFSNKYSHSFTKIDHRVKELKAELNILEQSQSYVVDKSNQTLKLYVQDESDTDEQSKPIKLKKKQKQTPVSFTLKEKIDLLRGINAAKDISNRFVATRNCDLFGFKLGTYSGKVRETTNLYDLYKKLKKSKKIIMDQETGYWYLTESNLEACTHDIETIKNYMFANPYVRQKPANETLPEQENARETTETRNSGAEDESIESRENTNNHEKDYIVDSQHHTSDFVYDYDMGEGMGDYYYDTVENNFWLNRYFSYNYK